MILESKNVFKRMPNLILTIKIWTICKNYEIIFIQGVPKLRDNAVIDGFTKSAYACTGCL